MCPARRVDVCGRAFRVAVFVGFAFAVKLMRIENPVVMDGALVVADKGLNVKTEFSGDAPPKRGWFF